MKSHRAATPHRWFALTLVTLMGLAAVSSHRPPGAAPNPGPAASDDRGDVPGWVMITMMTAIVVIALLAVFQEAVVTAVQNAFDSVAAEG